MMNGTVMNPMMQLLMPLCQQAISGMLPQQKQDHMMPISIQFDEEFADMAERYFDNLYDGRMEVPRQFKELVLKIFHELETDGKLHGSHQAHYGHKAPHRVFMTAVDHIIVNPSRADEIIDEHFNGLTDEERRVLKQYAKSRPTTKVQAQAVSMTEELYTSRLESIMNKTKYHYD